MTTLVQAQDITATTDGGGFITGSFDSAFDQVVCSAAAPLTNADATAEGTTPVVSATVAQTGAATFKARVWQTAAGNTVRAAANVQVTVTLIAFTQ